jgi:iron complex outermembrane receptor protein
VLALGSAPARARDGTAYETVVRPPPRGVERGREDEAASVSVITPDRTPRAGEDLAQLLAELPGMVVSRMGGLGAMATISIRGSAANQVQVYLDGIPLNSATWGSVDLGSLPIADLERIEVYRGMTPVGFGSSAIGGVVSLGSRVPRETEVRGHAGGGMFGTAHGGAQVSWALARVKLLASANFLRSDGDYSFWSTHGTLYDPSDDQRVLRQNNGLSQIDGLLRAAVPLPGRRDLLATLSFFQREKGLPPYGDFDAQGAKLGTGRFLGSVVYHSRDDLGTGGRVRVTAYGGTNQQRFHDVNQEIAYRPTSTRDRAVSAGATANASGLVASWLRLTGTADVRHELFAPFDQQSSDPSGPPGTRAFGALGTEAQLLVAGGALQVIPSVRLEAAHDEVVDRTLFGRLADQARPETYLLPIARLALLQETTRWLTLRANVGRYARLPTMFERYGNTGRVIGNPALRPEAGHNADLGAIVAVGPADGTSLVVDAAVFGALARDLIEFERNRDTSQARNIGRARILGAELAVTGQLGRYGRLVARGSFTDARNTTGDPAYDGRQLAQRPRLRAYARPELRRLPLPLGWRLGLHADVDLTGGNYVDPNNAVLLPRRLLFGAGASLESPAGRWCFVATAQNLGDAQSFDLVGYPLPGRALFFTLQWSSSGNRQPQEIVP